MAKESSPRVVHLPSDDEVKEAFEAYVEAVGKVAHAWNYLMENLGRSFVAVSGIDREIASAIWYASDNDRVLLLILKSTILAVPDSRWSRFPTARADMTWLACEAIELLDKRNNAIHAPCSLVTGVDGSEMTPTPLSQHRRARRLIGKQILVEFDWCERQAEGLSTFARQAASAILSPDYPWPNKPRQPSRRSKKDLLDQRHLLRSEWQPLPPRSSRE